MIDFEGETEFERWIVSDPDAEKLAADLRKDLGVKGESDALRPAAAGAE